MKIYLDTKLCETTCSISKTVRTILGTLANSVDPDQTPQNMAFDQSKQLHAGISIKNKAKMENYTRHPLNEKWTCPICKDE